MIDLKICVNERTGSRRALYAPPAKSANANGCYFFKILYCGKLSFQTDSARKFPPVRPSGAQAFAEQGAGAFQLPVATEKHIQRDKTVLRPSVNADVRLGEQQHAGHTHAVAKMMKMCGKCGRGLPHRRHAGAALAAQRRLRAGQHRSRRGQAGREYRGVSHVQSGQLWIYTYTLSAQAYVANL